MTDLKDYVLTLVDVGDGIHFMRTVEATYCGIVLDRELRATARGETAGALDDAGTEVCFACQTRWFNDTPDASAGRYKAQNPEPDIPQGDVDPASFIAGYLDGLDGR